MSRIHKALGRLNEERQNKQAPSPQKKASVSAAFNYGVISLLLLFVAVGSVLVNIKTLSQIENSRDMALMMAKHMDEQQGELKLVRAFLEKEQRQNETQIVDIKKEVTELKLAFAKINDLRVDNKLLLEKFMDLNDRVKQLNTN
jgi:hypothetical protein